MPMILALCLCLLLGAQPAWAEEAVANVKTVSGAATVRRGQNVLTPVPGEALFVGDILLTGPDGGLGVTFIDGTRLSLGPGAEAKVAAYAFEPLDKRYAFDVYLAKGSGAYTSGKLSRLAPESVRFTTPQATVGVRGTRFLVEVK